jgi:bifunctional non-homologous end joining protein LigD
MKDYIWLKPEIVAEIKFTEWTTGDILRHPEFVSLRDDKPPQEITRDS